MIHRDIHAKIELVLKEYPVVCLLGPRQVGKTTLAKSFNIVNKKKAVYIDLEKQSDVKKMVDIELFFLNHRDSFVIIDEVQYLPEIFSCLRPEVDEKRVNGRFLLTGSAAPELVRGVSESLAGRICYLEINPISLTEALHSKIKLTTHWIRGGFPTALNAKKNEVAERWKDNFIKSFAERDLSAIFGIALSSSIIKNFWEMLAGTQGSIWNAANFGRSLGISAPTTNRYLDLLEGAYMVRKLPAWYVNATKRLVKAPKIYIRDSGILHHFNQISTIKDLPGHIITGASWEGYVIEEICKKLPYNIRPFFYRTHQGAEIDLVLVKGLKPIIAIEIKYSLTPNVSKGFYEALDDLGNPTSYVIIPSGISYKTKQNSKIISFEEFILKDLRKIV